MMMEFVKTQNAIFPNVKKDIPKSVFGFMMFKYVNFNSLLTNMKGTDISKEMLTYSIIKSRNLKN